MLTPSPVPYSACNLALTLSPLMSLAHRFNAFSSFFAFSRSSPAAADSQYAYEMVISKIGQRNRF